MSNNGYGMKLPPGWATPGDVYKVPDMPESMKDFSYEEIQNALSALNHSQVSGVLSNLAHLSNSNTALKQWEVDKVEKAFLEFLAKHNSPLVKALK